MIEGDLTLDRKPGHSKPSDYYDYQLNKNQNATTSSNDQGPSENAKIENKNENVSC